MPLAVLLLFILLPLAELAVLIKVSQTISLGPTLLLVVVNSTLGLILLRRQGLGSLHRAQQSIDQGRLPVEGVADAAGLLVAGALLLTPGLITDVLGYLLLVPQVRHAIGRWLFARLRNSSNVRIDIFGMSGGSRRGPFRPSPPFGHDSPRHPTEGSGPVIEGEVIAPARNDNDDTDRRSPWRR